jgi:hypothetical protein
MSADPDYTPLSRKELQMLRETFTAATRTWKNPQASPAHVTLALKYMHQCIAEIDHLRGQLDAIKEILK